MTPVDPILPLSGSGDGIIIDRMEQVHAIKRREEHAEDDADERDRKRRERNEHGPQRGIWVRTIDDAEVTGAYDDHGRGGVHEGEPKPHLHLDTSA